MQEPANKARAWKFNNYVCLHFSQFKFKREILAEEIDQEGFVQKLGEEGKLKYWQFLKRRHVICLQIHLEFIIKISWVYVQVVIDSMVSYTHNWESGFFW